MTMLANVFANDAKSVETLESKNEIYIITDKTILRNSYAQTTHYGKIPWETGLWITDAEITVDYYRYITKNNRLGLGLGTTLNPALQFYDIYCVTKLKVPLTNRWFIGLGAGLGNTDCITIPEYKINNHRYFKLFTCFDFKNISIYLSYVQDIIYGKFIEIDSLIARYEALNLGIGTRFTI
jgi:hypothetical protein